jgi:7-cyano-7-deazaguanine synthase in queuosine biosynthesis
MRTCVLLFSGGLDSVAFAALLAKDGFAVTPVYCSHRHGGNVTKRELVVASQLAPEITGNDLVIVKKPPPREGADAWYYDLGEVLYSSKLPVTKEEKPKRNRIFLKVLREVGLDDFDFVALATLGPSETTPRERVPDVAHDKLERSARWIEPGQLITPEAYLEAGGKGATKVALLKALGRSKKARDWCYRSDSCLMYFNRHCGNCKSCKERVEAFKEAWGKDRTNYRKGTAADKAKRRR